MIGQFNFLRNIQPHSHIGGGTSSSLVVVDPLLPYFPINPIAFIITLAF